ncbi:MAG: hypothetical protein ABJL44_02840 [Algibacter sp.]
MLNKIRLFVIRFIESKNTTVALAFFTAIAAGLYPLLHYYNSNFSQVNSWSQFAFFIITFLLFPAIIFVIVYVVFKKVYFFKKFTKYILPVLNYSSFLVFVIIVLYGSQKILMVLAILLAVVLGIIFYKHLRKILVFQFLLGLLVLTKLTPEFYRHITYSKKWMEQPDKIEKVVLTKKPNIYVIQPDGYANFSELKKGHYNFDNNSFGHYLIQKDFTLYQDFRSNYRSTLSSNSSMFAMKHHYYNKQQLGGGELYKSRDVIAGDNPVVSIFKNNNYKTFLILEKPYLLVNRPKMFYDYCNFNYDELPYLDRGLNVSKNVVAEVKKVISVNKETSNFFFIEKMLPGHISNSDSNSRGKEQERLDYLKNLRACNDWLKKIITTITDNDDNCMIIIVADHGGFVGMNSTSDSFKKQEDKDVVRSIFTSTLAIKWNGEAPGFDDELKTNVNLFRVLFSYLSNDDVYLNNLQRDESFTIIQDASSLEVYELINNDGSVVFNKVSK